MLYKSLIALAIAAVVGTIAKLTLNYKFNS